MASFFNLKKKKGSRVVEVNKSESLNRVGKRGHVDAFKPSESVTQVGASLKDGIKDSKLPEFQPESGTPEMKKASSGDDRLRSRKRQACPVEELGNTSVSYGDRHLKDCGSSAPKKGPGTWMSSELESEFKCEQPQAGAEREKAEHGNEGLNPGELSESILTDHDEEVNDWDPVMLSRSIDSRDDSLNSSSILSGQELDFLTPGTSSDAIWRNCVKSAHGHFAAQSSGTLMVPQTSKSSRRLSLSAAFELPRFRKRQHEKENDDCDNVSIHSLDVSVASCKKKSKRSLLRVSASLVNLISSSNRQKNVNDGFKVPRSPISQNASPYRPPKPSPAKRRSQLTWVDWVAGGKSSSILPELSNTDIKRQEAIYELYQGEKDMLEDLINVTKMYRDSLVTLGLMSQTDVSTLFGNIDSLIPVHEDLVERLQGQRKPDGTTQNVGKQIHEWAGGLNVYVRYCANQIRAKSIFDERKNEPSVDDFLQRCIASPFSRKLDLWTLLDGARGRFVKYPLLVRSILKYTPGESRDIGHLEKSIKLIEKIIQEADEQTGLARCEHSKSSLVYLFDEQKVPEIDESTALMCSGCMKSSKGSKLYIFLFDKVAVVSRPTTQSGRQMYQIYRQPIPATELVVEDLPDGEVKMGSFRSAFGQGAQAAKNLIRISFQDTERGQSHTLIISDEHDKRQWMQAFHKVTSRVIVVGAESKTKEKQPNN